MWKRFQLSRFNLYQVPSSFLSLRVAAGLLVGELVLSVLGYMYIESYSLADAFYMTMITISTVGFTEVQPLSTAGRLFTSFIILLNIGIFAYALAVFTYYVIQGEIFKTMHTNHINTSIQKLSQHVILCGYGKYGREIAEHFTKHEVPFVVIDQDDGKIEELQKSADRILYLHDDATHDEVLLKANINEAAALISALPDDSDNVFVVLSARQLSPALNIISRAKDFRSQKKLLMAGANHVVMPEQIGGFYMATLISKPGAVEFFSFITNEYRSDIGFEEVDYEDLPLHCRGKSLRELHLRRQTGSNIIGYKAPDGHYEVNPAPDTILQPGASFIVLGNKQQLQSLLRYLQELKAGRALPG
ncbi:potassium channel family protein [Phaeodactylibacter luteus]|uniref:Potassium channel protein n=1 Tax=Phaeodactylibacter luteus TaxID=1564516 RepID=A0A5C6RLE3_9BACT|nr:potassium channel protein [Phaeodactylibacter luteus]TXB63188.1 potassium channel protein [Phaeodactylibacter luteus]